MRHCVKTSGKRVEIVQLGHPVSKKKYPTKKPFGTQTDLERKLDDYKVFYNQYRCHTGLVGVTPAQRTGASVLPHARFDSYRWRQHCNGLFQTPAAA
jgi:hypothetical protein